MKLMLDECIFDKPIRTALENESALNVRTTVDCGFRRGEADAVLVNVGTKKHKRLLVTKNHKDINEIKYPPCNHGGILVFHKQELTVEYVIPRVKALKILQLARKAIGHVTYIYDDRIKVITHHEIIEKKFDESKKIRSLIKGR